MSEEAINSEVSEPVVIEPTTEELLQEANELQKRITTGMPTHLEMKKGEPRAIQRQIDWERSTRRDTERYCEIRKLLPDLPSVEALRL